MAPRRIRGPLAARFYHDIDMVNAHFVIMNQIALSHRLELEAVRRVVVDRDSVLEEVQTHYRCGRAAAKELLIAQQAAARQLAQRRGAPSCAGCIPVCHRRPVAHRRARADFVWLALVNRGVWASFDTTSIFFD